MASERQIAANRRNAKKSSGPRTTEGKARSRNNALRHGLAVPIGVIPAFQPDVLALAQLLSPSDEQLCDAAVTSAEVEIDLLRIRQHRAALIQRQSGPFSADTMDELSKLERYERRAFSRRNKALRATER